MKTRSSSPSSFFVVTVHPDTQYDTLLSTINVYPLCFQNETKTILKRFIISSFSCRVRNLIKPIPENSPILFAIIGNMCQCNNILGQISYCFYFWGSNMIMPKLGTTAYCRSRAHFTTLKVTYKWPPNFLKKWPIVHVRKNATTLLPCASSVLFVCNKYNTHLFCYTSHLFFLVIIHTHRGLGGDWTLTLLHITQAPHTSVYNNIIIYNISMQ